MHEPVRIPRGLWPKEGHRQVVGPRIREAQVKFLEKYEEDKKQGRAPLKLDSIWPDTPSRIPEGIQRLLGGLYGGYLRDRPFRIISQRRCNTP